MGAVTDRKDGLFPSPREIKYQCTCPDYAGMCKHIAAVVYGIGARLDERPELLFVLRGVDHEELIDADAAASAVMSAGAGKGSSRRRRLAAERLDGVFGVEFDAGDEMKPVAKNARPFQATPASIRKLRAGLGLSRQAFAKKLGVSAPSVANWENKNGPWPIENPGCQARPSASARLR